MNTICNNIFSQLTAQQNNFNEQTAPKGKKQKKRFNKESARVEQNRRLLRGLIIAEEIMEEECSFEEQTYENIRTNYCKLLSIKHNNREHRRCSVCNINICRYGEFCKKSDCPYCHNPAHHCCMICGKIPCGDVVRNELDGCSHYNRNLFTKRCMTDTDTYCHHSSKQRVFVEELLLSIYNTCTISERIERACMRYDIDIHNMDINDVFRQVNEEIINEDKMKRERYEECKENYRECLMAMRESENPEDFQEDLTYLECELKSAERSLKEHHEHHIDKALRFKTIKPRIIMGYPGTVYDTAYSQVRVSDINNFNVHIPDNETRFYGRTRIRFEPINIASLHNVGRLEKRLLIYVKYERLIEIENNEPVIPTAEDFPAL